MQPRQAPVRSRKRKRDTQSRPQRGGSSSAGPSNAPAVIELLDDDSPGARPTPQIAADEQVARQLEAEEVNHRPSLTPAHPVVSFLLHISLRYWMQAQAANTEREERRRAIERRLRDLEQHERHRAILARIAQIESMRARLGLTPSSPLHAVLLCGSLAVCGICICVLMCCSISWCAVCPDCPVLALLRRHGTARNSWRTAAEVGKGQHRRNHTRD